MTNVFVYLRVSGKGQVRGDGFLRQFLAVRKYCEENGLRIVGVFRERGVSGTKELEDRPALSALFAALEDGGADGVVIERLDRMARDLMVQETIIEDMKKHAYKLFSVYEPDLCSEEPSRILIRQIFGALAQWERAMIVLKLRGARQRMKQRHGRCEGRKVFGDKAGEQEVLGLIFELRDGGHTSDRIAEILNARGIMTRYGKQWRGSSVARILGRRQPKSVAA